VSANPCRPNGAAKAGLGALAQRKPTAQRRRTVLAATEGGGARTPRCGDEHAARDGTDGRAAAQPAARDAAARSLQLARGAGSCVGPRVLVRSAHGFQVRPAAERASPPVFCPPPPVMATLLSAASALTLDTLPPLALAHVLSSPRLALADLGRAACASKKLCAAATNAALPQWAAVRVIGAAPRLDEGTFEARAVAALRFFRIIRARLRLLTRGLQGLEAVMPAASFKSITPRSLFESEAWEAAYAADPRLKSARMFDDGGDASIISVERDIEARWSSMSDDELQRYTNKTRDGEKAHAAYKASQCVSASHKPTLLRALLRRASGVHTLCVSVGGAQPPNDGSSLLRDAATAWGASLRFVRLDNLGPSGVTAEDIHVLLAACPLLALLDIGRLRLSACNCCGAAAFDALFHGMAPHAQLRAVVLPSAPQHLQRFVERLLKKCPALREINAESFDASAYGADDDEEDYYGEYGSKRQELVVTLAKLAASRGVTRFLCSTFFAEGGSDGEYGSDGGSVSEYCGDGNVLKYLHA